MSGTAVVVMRTCEVCRASFESRATHARYCSDTCRYKAKLVRYREDESQRERTKARCRRWYEANRGAHVARTTERKRQRRAVARSENPVRRTGEIRTCAHCGETYTAFRETTRFCTERCRRREKDRRDSTGSEAMSDGSWNAAAPTYRTHLPGGACELFVLPATKLEHRHLRILHGVVTGVTGAHDPNLPRFVLIPAQTQLGWGVWLSEDEMARAFAARDHEVRWVSRNAVLRAGPLLRIKAPVAPEPGKRRVRVDALTPVLVRNNNRHTNVAHTHTAPTQGNLHSTLTAWLPRRIGLEIDPSLVRLELVSRETFPEHVPIGKVGGTRGWIGNVTLDVNAPALWLLRVAERIGFGGRCAFGFGRIRVEEIAWP